MCSKPKPPPPVVQRDPVAEARQAELEATQKANQDLAAKKARRRQSALFTGKASGGGGMSRGGNSVLAQAYAQGGKPLLGS